MSADVDITLPMPGLRLEFLDPANAEILSDGGRLHFLIKVDELQFQHLMGRVHKPDSDTPSEIERVKELNTRNPSQIPWHLLGAFFYCAEPGQRSTNIENWTYQDLGNSIRNFIRKNPFNEIFEPFLGGPLVPKSVQFQADEGTTLPPMPVVLALDVEFDLFRTFFRKYSRQLRSPAGKSFEQEVEPLRRTLRSKIGKVEKKLAEQTRIVAPMRKAVAHLHVGDVLFQAALDFDQPLPVRRELWKGVKFDTHGDYTDPVPTNKQVGNVVALRKEWELMTKGGERFVAHHASGARLDPFTLPILDELRDGQAVWKRYFDKRKTLHPAVRAELLQTIADALDCVILGAESRDKLVKREVALVAEHISLAFDSSKVSDVDAALVSELRSLDVARLLPADSTDSPLFDAFKDSIAWLHESAQTTGSVVKGADKSLEGLQILTAVTPLIVGHLRREEASGQSALAWIWRAAIGTGGVEAESLARLQERVLSVVREHSKAPSRGLGLGSKVPPKLASAVGVGVSFLGVLSDLLAIHTAYDEAEKSQSEADGLVIIVRGAKAIKSAVGAAEVLSKAIAETLSNKNTARKFAEASKAIGKASPIIEICVEFLSLSASVAKSNEKDIFRTAQEQHDADTAALLDLVSLVVTALSFAPQFKILAVIFAVARFLIEEPSVWIPAVSPRLKAPTNAQLYLASHVEALLKDREFRDLITQVKDRKVEDSELDDAKGVLGALKELKDRLEAGVDKATPLLWGLGSRETFGHDTNRDSIEVLEKIYRFPPGAARQIVEGKRD